MTGTEQVNVYVHYANKLSIWYGNINGFVIYLFIYF